jgi:hypothetical protein
MKRIFTILATVAFGAMVMTSCSSSDDNNGSQPQPLGPGGATKPAATATATAKKVTFPTNSDIKEATFDEGGNYDVVLTKTLRDRIIGGTAEARALKDVADEWVHMTGKYTAQNGVYEMQDFGKMTITEDAAKEEVTAVVEAENCDPITETVEEVAPVVELKGLASDICRSWTIQNTTFDYWEYEWDNVEVLKNHYQGNFTNPQEARDLEWMQAWLKREHNTEIDADFSKKKYIKNVSFNQYGKFTINFANESSIGDWWWVDEREERTENATGLVRYDWEDWEMENDFETGVAKVEMVNGYLVLTLTGQMKEQHNKHQMYRVDVQFVLAEDK